MYAISTSVRRFISELVTEYAPSFSAIHKDIFIGENISET